MTDTTSKYTFYILRKLPPGVFGEAYVVVASANVTTGTWRAEHHILTQRPKECLHSGALIIDGRKLPAELGIVDAEFAIGEGLHQAEIDIIDLLEKRSIELDRPDVALMPFELKECQSPFVGCRMRGRFLKQLTDIGNSTKCPSLSRYMSLVQQINVAKMDG
jgi:hypothetical protein